MSNTLDGIHGQSAPRYEELQQEQMQGRRSGGGGRTNDLIVNKKGSPYILLHRQKHGMRHGVNSGSGKPTKREKFGNLPRGPCAAVSVRSNQVL
jgi:hypothetical protein